MDFCDKFGEDDACSVLCILTHGTETHVYGSDGEAVEKQEILGYLNSCTAMRGKPKVVIIQACQGGELPDLLLTTLRVTY